jgi:capsular exopolysaccharide synthesis family protein
MDTQKTSGAPDAKLHFLDYWRIIRIRKTVILAVFLLVVLTTTAVTFILPETYSSTVRIEVGKDTTDIAPLLYGAQNQNQFDPYFIQTEFEKIKSKTVLYEVIENPKLKLKEIYSKRYNAEGLLKTPEIYPILAKNVDVRQSRNTSLIEIRVFSENKQEAAEVANEIAEVYKRLRLKVRQEASKNAINILNDNLADQEKKVADAQKNVDKLRADFGGISDIGDAGSVATLEPETVRAFERERITAQARAAQVEKVYERLAELGSTNIEALTQAIPTAVPDSELSRLLADYNQAQTAWARSDSELGEKQPAMKAIAATLTTLRAQISARVQGILKGLQEQAEAQTATAMSLSNEVAQAKRRDAEMLERYRPYFLAKRDLETQQRIRETIKIRILQETVDAALPKTTIVTVTDPAEPGSRPVHPNIPLNIALGVVVGLLMGFGLAFFIEYLDTSVKTIDDVEKALQAPVLGVIPQNVGALIEEGPESPHAEAYRVLRTNVLFSRKNPNLNTLTVVSGGAGEGKSTTIFNLATVFAQNGQRVLMVDSDLRRPSLHKLLNVSNSLGLTNYLLKQNTLEEVIQTTKLPTLHFLASGKLPSSSLGILNSPQMKEFIKAVKERYDFVFFDSPPIMGVSDASILASEVDMSLLVIQYRKYPQAMTIRAKQMVEKVGGLMLGVVLNNINISQDSYYYYYSGYYYDYYSKYESSSGEDSKNNGRSKKASGDRPGLDLKQKY